MKKFLFIVVFGVLALALGLFLVVDFGLGRVTELMLPAARKAMDSYGIVFDDIAIGNAGVSFPMDVQWEGVKGKLESSRNSALAKQAVLEFSMGKVEVRPMNLGLSRVRLSLEDVEAHELYSLKSAGDADISGLWFRIDDFSWIVSNLSIKDPLPALQGELEALRTIMKSGVSPKRFQAVGSLGFNLKGRDIELRFKSVKSGDVYKLEAERAGVESLASAYSESLTDAEIDVVASYPLQAPQMLQIKDYAATTAKAARSKDKSVPQDAYRHVLWSYHLTLQFGAELAEKITDAHEVGSKTNTEADHRMDYNNNRIGRRIALEGKSEGEILKFVKTAPDVIRTPI